MATDEVRVPYKCGRDGTEWEAMLRKDGPKLRFIRFEQAGAIKEPEEDPKTRISRGWRQAQEAFRTRPPLGPPPQVELVDYQLIQKLTADQISRFGFQCPSCKDLNPLLCPECKKYSCQGGPKDLADRIECTWCGETLEFVTRAPGEPQPPPTEIDVTEKHIRTRTRELPPGRDYENDRRE